MATSATHDRLLTAEEFYALPDDGIPYELVEGRVVPLFVDDDGRPMTGAGARHCRVSARLLMAVGAYVDARGIGAVFGEQLGLRLRRDPDTQRSPDLTYVPWDRLPDGRLPVGPLTVVPDLVAEVLSPNDRASDVFRKIREYLDAGVRIVWVADPETRVVTTYTPDGVPRVHGEHDALDGGDVLPDLRIPVGPLFAFERP
ncbi:MAG: Uma2 family endonuclease, partial [Gemmatirosa sp.]|nr:Uma2 family endonuclease [Gemmatirosa sp.]